MSVLPTLPRATEYTALVVVVSTLSDLARQRLETVIKGEYDDRYKPTFVYCLGNIFQQQLEKYGQDGSVAQIYSIATNASTKGWKQFIIVDALSREQLNGDVRPGRSQDISVVCVQVGLTAVRDGLHEKANKEMHVSAKRMHIDAASYASRPGNLLSFRIPRDQESSANTLQKQCEEGIRLYNPFEAVFNNMQSFRNTQYDLHSAIEQVFSLDPPFPPEIVTKIMASALENQNLKNLTTAPFVSSTSSWRDTMDIYLLVAMSSDEVTSLQTLWNEKLRIDADRMHPVSTQKRTCVLHRWIASRPANRQDIWDLFQRVCDKDRSRGHTTFLFVGWAGWGKDHEVGMMQWNHGQPPPVYRFTIERAAEIFYNYKLHPKPHPFGPRDEITSEFMLNPKARFFYDPPPFVRLVERDVMTVPTFILTKHVTEEEILDIKIELQRSELDEEDIDPPLYFAFVKWDSDKDGTMEDMWSLLWQCTGYKGYGSEWAAIFVDKQSTIDHKVIVAEVLQSDPDQQAVEDEEYYPYTGFMYGRQPIKEIPEMWQSMERESSNFEHYFSGEGSLPGEDGKYYKYFRPDVVWEIFEPEVETSETE